MRLKIRHETLYQYETPVTRSIQSIRLRPLNTPQQRVIDWHLSVPGEHWQVNDGFGNNVTMMTMERNMETLRLVASGTVVLTGKPLTANQGPLAPEVFLRSTPLTEADAAIIDFARHFGRNKRSLTRLMGELSKRIVFMPGTTTVNHSASQAFAQNAGVCQDHTHIFLACCRYLGLPARYVSGYVQSDSEYHIATHAWAEVYLGRNWHTFDVVNNMGVADSHIKLAVGLDYRDAAPVRGMRSGGGTETMSTEARVTITQSDQ
ncbi:MAG: transglutaminase family protein [Halomonadaceae bacterium]|nr:MAG: transglutaminase family protein [Halomonadaceae bacterium]